MERERLSCFLGLFFFRYWAVYLLQDYKRQDYQDYSAAGQQLYPDQSQGGSRVLHVFSGFPPTAPKHAGSWIGDFKLPLNVNVHPWCLVMHWCPVQCAFSLHTQYAQASLQPWLGSLLRILCRDSQTSVCITAQSHLLFNSFILQIIISNITLTTKMHFTC